MTVKNDAVEDDLLLERQLCFALSVAARSIVAAYRPGLKELNLTHPQYLVMLALWERSPRSVKELSAALLLEPATISPLLKRLEAAGLITRGRVDGNERTLAVKLTAQGAELRQKALAVPTTMAARLGLGREDGVELHAMMQRLITAAQRATENDARGNAAGEDQRLHLAPMQDSPAQDAAGQDAPTGDTAHAAR